tara:strand:+ start:1557 stop:2336 length:780 start_codon:yes stop_codon:yes gene_type:complete
VKSLQGKIIVIIGGTSGIGLSAALAVRAAGGKVVVMGRSRVKVKGAVRELGRAGRGLVGDAGKARSAVRAVSLAVREFGRLDGLYHVAGGSGRAAGDGPLGEISDTGWEETLRHNLDSVFYSNRAAVRQFRRQDGGGAVLNLGSVLGFAPSPKFFATHAYAAAKAGIIGLTRAAASHYAREDIRFNVLAPALVDTPMSERAQGDAETMGYIERKQPLDGGRIGAPEDLDGAAVYLLSDAARAVTGQVLSVDGGWSVSEG